MQRRPSEGSNFYNAFKFVQVATPEQRGKREIQDFMDLLCIICIVSIFSLSVFIEVKSRFLTQSEKIKTAQT